MMHMVYFSTFGGSNVGDAQPIFARLRRSMARVCKITMISAKSRTGSLKLGLLSPIWARFGQTRAESGRNCKAFEKVWVGLGQTPPMSSRFGSVR